MLPGVLKKYFTDKGVKTRAGLGGSEGFAERFLDTSLSSSAGKGLETSVILAQNRH